MTTTRQARRNTQREDLDRLQFAGDPMERLLAGERLIAGITADRNRAFIAACAEYGRAAVADALGITRQAVYKRLQGSAVGKLVRSPQGADRRSRIRALMPTGAPPVQPAAPDASDRRADPAHAPEATTEPDPALAASAS